MATVVMGCGHWGRNILRVLKDDLAIIYDIHQDSLDSLGEAYAHIPKTSSLDDVWQLETIKRAVIATPARTHYGLAKKALRHGLDVFVEKPVTTSSAEAEELNALAQSTGRVLMVGHLMNYHPAVRLLSAIIEKSTYGCLRKIQTRRLGFGKFRPDVDVMWDLGCHDVSMTMCLFGKGGFQLDESSLKCVRSKTIGAQYDTVTAQATFKNDSKEDAVLEINASWLNAVKERVVQLVFEKAIVSWDAMKALDDETSITVTEFNPGLSPSDTTSRLDMYKPELIGKNGRPIVLPLDIELNHFLDCCRDRSTPMTDGSEGIRVVRFLELLSKCPNESCRPTEGCDEGFESLPDAVIPERSDVFIHPTAVVDEGAKIGKGTKIWHFCHISANCSIGTDCSFGQNCYVAPGAIVGNGVRVQNNVSIYDGVVCEDEVFLGPAMVFTNDKVPRAFRRNTYVKTYVRTGAAIGANATIVCGTTLGEYCMVGAGSVVTKDVKPYALVYGNPATQRGWVDGDGNKLEGHPNTLPPFFTIKEEWKIIKEGVKRRMDKVIEEERFVNGPEVKQLEKELAQFVGVPHCIAVSSGTDALKVALMSLHIGAGDEVIVPTFTFIATAEVVAVLGATPVFVDVLPDTYNINPMAVEEAISSKTRVIIAVSLFGEMAKMEGIGDILDKLGRRDIILIEDAAQSFGARCGELKSCSIAEISCTSFYPTKPLGCFGDGGAVFTKDENIASLVRQISNHGMSKPYHHALVGINSRMDSLQAAVLLSKLSIFPDTIQSRRNVAAIYHKYLGAETSLLLPALNESSVYAQFTVQVDDQIGRDKLQAELEKFGVMTRVFYPSPLHLQPAFQETECIVKPCPVAAALCKKVLSLPIFPYMKEEDATAVALLVQKAIKLMTEN